jgi:hypothetical protein
MKRAPSHRGGTAVRFTDRTKLYTAVLEACREEFQKTFGEEWTDVLRERYALDPGLSVADDLAGKLRSDLHKVLVDLKHFLWFESARDEAMERAESLYRWLDEHPEIAIAARSYGGELSVDEGVPTKTLPSLGVTHRYAIVHRVRRGSPLSPVRLRMEPGRSEKRGFALISLLTNSRPTLEEKKLKSPGYTVAEVIDLERKYMDKVAKAEEQDFGTPGEGDLPGAPRRVRHGLK